MAALLPPEDFSTKFEVPTVELSPGRWWRLARIERKPLDWDGRPGESRFVSKKGGYQLLYLAPDKETAFWEVFSKRLLPLPPEERVLSRATRNERRWVEFDVPSGLQVVDLTNIRTVRELGASNSSFHGEWGVAQLWGEAIWLHPTKVDGLLYRSDKNDLPCVAVFRRSKQKRLALISAKAGGKFGSDVVFLNELRSSGGLA